MKGVSKSSRCFYCCSEIHAEARVCAECGRSQNVAANRIAWWSGAVGLITFVGSAALFLESFASSQWARHYGADVQVLNVSSLKTLTLFNNSSVDTIIDDVQFEMPGRVELLVTVNESLPAGGTSNVDLGALYMAQTSGPFLEVFARDNARRQVALEEITEEKASRILSELSLNDYELKNGSTERYTVEAINRGGADWEFFKREGGEAKYLSTDCAISITYQVVQGNSFELTPPCVGIVKYRK